MLTVFLCLIGQFECLCTRCRMMLVESMHFAFDEMNTPFQPLNAEYRTPCKRSRTSTYLRQPQRYRRIHIHISQHIGRHRPRQQRPPRHHPPRPTLKDPIPLRV